MSKSYDDPRFGVEQCFSSGVLATLNGTNASATTIARFICNKAMKLNTAVINLLVGGTDAVTTLVLNSSLAGTGALVPLGTQALGTSADNTSETWAVTGTLNAGDALVLQSAAGTSTQLRKPLVQLFVQETFA